MPCFPGLEIPNRRVVQEGVYAWERHPAYLGALLWGIGWGITRFCRRFSQWNGYRDFPASYVWLSILPEDTRSLSCVFCALLSPEHVQMEWNLCFHPTSHVLAVLSKYMVRQRCDGPFVCWKLPPQTWSGNMPFSRRRHAACPLQSGDAGHGGICALGFFASCDHGGREGALRWVSRQMLLTCGDCRWWPWDSMSSNNVEMKVLMGQII